MKRLWPLLPLALALLLFMSCEKTEKITETEYVHDIKYIETPPDTVIKIDTLIQYDTVFSDNPDTASGTDTVYQVDTVYNNATDTVTNVIHDTTTIFDTVTVTNTIYDTVNTTDTVLQQSCAPYLQFAYSAMQYHADAEVINFIKGEFGYDDGWVYYLSVAMSDVQSPSTGVYDIYGYIDYWAPDFSGYYPLEYYYRVSLVGSDPADPDHWQLSEPPAAANKNPGVRVAPDTETRPFGK